MKKKARPKALPLIVECILCSFCPDKKRPNCSMCRGTGSLEASFKKGLADNEIEHTGKTGRSGHQKVNLPIGAKPK